MAERTMRDRFPLGPVKFRRSVGRQTLFVVVGFVVGGALIAGVLHELVIQSERERERNWISVSGTIEDVRGVLVGQASGYSGGGMLYNVQVLAAYQMHNSIERRWIRVGERPIGWDGLETAKRMLKGRHCIVLVNPKNTEQTEVEFLKQ